MLKKYKDSSESIKLINLDLSRQENIQKLDENVNC